MVTVSSLNSECNPACLPPREAVCIGGTAHREQPLPLSITSSRLHLARSGRMPASLISFSSPRTACAAGGSLLDRHGRHTGVAAGKRRLDGVVRGLGLEDHAQQYRGHADHATCRTHPAQRADAGDHQHGAQRSGAAATVRRNVRISSAPSAWRRRFGMANLRIRNPVRRPADLRGPRGRRKQMRGAMQTG